MQHSPGGTDKFSRYRASTREVLKVLEALHHLRGETWKARAYGRGADIVVSEIRMPNLDRPKEAAGVGASIARVIVATLAFLEARPQNTNIGSNGDTAGPDVAVSVGLISVKDADSVRAYRAFSEVLGVGDKKAQELVRAGYTSVAHVRKDRERLDFDRPSITEVGLRYYDELRTRIPYKLAADIARRVERAIGSSRVAEPVPDPDRDRDRDRERYDDLKIAIPLGSLRRIKNRSGRNKSKNTNPDVFANAKAEASSVGDVDLLVLVPSEEEFRALARRLPRAFKDDFLTSLGGGSRRYSFVMRHATSTTTSTSSSTSYLVARVDVFRAKDRTEWASFLLHGTGSAAFNERLRAHAKRRGFRLNEYGLFPLKKDSSSSPRIILEDERDVFARLGISYVTPGDRE